MLAYFPSVLPFFVPVPFGVSAANPRVGRPPPPRAVIVAFAFVVRRVACVNIRLPIVLVISTRSIITCIDVDAVVVCTTTAPRPAMLRASLRPSLVVVVASRVMMIRYVRLNKRGGASRARQCCDVDLALSPGCLFHDSYCILIQEEGYKVGIWNQQTSAFATTDGWI